VKRRRRRVRNVPMRLPPEYDYAVSAPSTSFGDEKATEPVSSFPGAGAEAASCSYVVRCSEAGCDLDVTAYAAREAAVAIETHRLLTDHRAVATPPAGRWNPGVEDTVAARVPVSVRGKGQRWAPAI
jgi:hypothetical protein